MPKAIKYETTSIDAKKTASEILGLLVQYGARHTSIEWDEGGQPRSVSFVIRDPNAGEVPVHLVARVNNVARILEEREPWNNRRRATRIEYTQAMREKAHRIVWRHLKDLIEQQLLAVYIGQYELTDVFMHGLVLEDGSTVGDRFRERADQLLGTRLLQIATPSSQP